MCLSQFYVDAADCDYVLHKLSEALAGLTALTALSLAGHDMPVCPASVAHLPCLKQLDVCLNAGLRQLPHGPWPALECLHLDEEMVDAALADPPVQHSGLPSGLMVGGALVPVPPVRNGGHALWSLTHLTYLEVFWQEPPEGCPAAQVESLRQEKELAIIELLPQLHYLDSLE